jgi:hypothetical protein
MGRYQFTEDLNLKRFDSAADFDNYISHKNYGKSDDRPFIAAGKKNKIAFFLFLSLFHAS